MTAYTGRPAMPERIGRIEELATDLWWTWQRDARAVFRRLDYPLWRQTAHNPVRMLRMLPRETLERALANPSWLTNYDRAVTQLDAARSAHNTWSEAACPERRGRSIAYFSAEFAL